MALIDIAVAGAFFVLFLDVRNGSSPGYKELETITGAYGGVCACTGVLAFMCIVTAQMGTYGLLPAYFYSAVLRVISSIATVCAVLVLQDEVCYEAKAIRWTGGFIIPSYYPCNYVAVILSSPAVVLFFLSIYELLVLARARAELVGSDPDLLIFRKPLLYQYTERTGVPSLSPRNEKQAGFFRLGPTRSDDRGRADVQLLDWIFPSLMSGFTPSNNRTNTNPDNVWNASTAISNRALVSRSNRRMMN